jgi:hypothetical protein
VGDDRIDGLGKRMAKVLDLHVADSVTIPSRLVYLHQGYPLMLAMGKSMMPNRGSMLVG